MGGPRLIIVEGAASVLGLARIARVSVSNERTLEEINHSFVICMYGIDAPLLVPGICAMAASLGVKIQ